MKHTHNFLHAIFAFLLLFFAACQTEIGTSQETKTCVVGPNNLGGNVANTADDVGLYTINWTAVPGATGYQVTTVNESNNNAPLGTVTASQPFATSNHIYTCDSFLFRVKPILPNGTLCIPQGQDVRLSRVRGGITAIIVNRTTGSSCGSGLPSLKYFNDSSFVLGRIPITSGFSDGTQDYVGLQRTFNNKILNNVDSAGYLKIIVKNCSGVVTNTRTEFVNRTQTGGLLTELSSAIIGAAGRTGIQNPATNTNAFIENIAFER